MAVASSCSSGLLASLLCLLWCCASCVTAQGENRLIFASRAGGTSSCTTPEGERATCKSISDCGPISDYIQSLPKPITDEARKKLQPYRCGGSQSGLPNVCCPKGPLTGGVDLLPMESCGVNANIDRIVNGINASLAEFPWMAVLMYRSSSGPVFRCAGTLINKRYVLTAAHCIKQKEELVAVRLGEHDFASDKDCQVSAFGTTCSPRHQDFDVTVDDTIIHPKYDTSSLVNDIALIRLSRDADVSVSSVKPICLPVQQVSKRTTFTKKLTVSGWGVTEKGDFSQWLLKVFVNTVDNDKCSLQYKGPIVITDQQLCAGGKNSQNTCKGDSGGPLMQQVTIDDVLRMFQFGIVSAGPSLCEKLDFPVRYTRVTSYVDWIVDNIRP